MKKNTSKTACKAPKGYRFVLEPEESTRERYLHRPSLGALFFTQGWTLGARMYIWFVLSLIPLLGLVSLFVCVVFGRRLSWKYGGWTDWKTFEKRMFLLDIAGVVWILFLIGGYVLFKK